MRRNGKSKQKGSKGAVRENCEKTVLLKNSTNL